MFGTDFRIFELHSTAWVASEYHETPPLVRLPDLDFECFYPDIGSGRQFYRSMRVIMYDSDSRVILGLQVKKNPKAGIRIVLFEGAYILSHWHVGLQKNEDEGPETRAYIGVIKISTPTRKLKRAQRQRHQASGPVESPIEGFVVSTTLVKESAPIEPFIDRRLCWKCHCVRY
jgi:hypothetical protein